MNEQQVLHSEQNLLNSHVLHLFIQFLKQQNNMCWNDQ